MNIILDLIQISESTLDLFKETELSVASQKKKKKKKKKIVQNVTCLALKASLTCNREVIERVWKICILWLLLVSDKGPIGF